MKLKHWTNYRIEELEQKADNSGFSFDNSADEAEGSLGGDDAYLYSVSKRMDGISMSAMHYEDEDGYDDRF
ncbi:MAG: hypothetical protein ACYTBJ_00640 [Planctomycetota bacterium]|jgi:hypothetical protein